MENKMVAKSLLAIIGRQNHIFSNRVSFVTGVFMVERRQPSITLVRSVVGGCYDSVAMVIHHAIRPKKQGNGFITSNQ